MASERKSVMVSVRLPAALVARVDYVGRNTDSGAVKNRSTAVHAALEEWLPGQEKRIEALLGTSFKKVR